MKTIEHLFSKSALEMTPYSPIEPPDQIAKRLGLNEENIIKLDANENPYGTSEEVLKTLAAEKYYHIYPDPAQVQLREAIAAYADCEPVNIIGGTGADEIIDLVCRLVLEPGENTISFVPTFSYYSHVIALNRCRYRACPREADFSISLDRVKDISLEGCKLVILCSPNNPSGNLLEEEVLDYFLDKDLIVMVDEAYYEFSNRSFIRKTRDHENLIVLRTFSKCFGLAGLRVGYGVGSESLIKSLMKIKPPFSVNVAAENALKTCLKHLPSFQEQVKKIIATRERTQEKLSQFRQVKVFPSQSNFILCEIEDYDAALLCRELERKGILVRHFATDLLRNFIRISVGTESQMKTFISQLSTIVS